MKIRTTIAMGLGGAPAIAVGAGGVMGVKAVWAQSQAPGA